LIVFMALLGVHRGESKPAEAGSLASARSGRGIQLSSEASVTGEYHPEDEVEAQWFGRGGIEPLFGSAYNGYLTWATESGREWPHVYAGLGTYAQGC
jgi:hypothetical protein